MKQHPPTKLFEHDDGRVCAKSGLVWAHDDGICTRDHTEARIECSATMPSMQDPDHTHVCSGKHDAGDHFCPAPCSRYWFRREPDDRPEEADRVRRRPGSGDGTAAAP
jgi:hypothetical protein